MPRKKRKQFPFHDEKKLVQTANLFFNRSLVETQKSFYYEPTNKRKRYQVDCLIEKRKIIIEYDGPDHYRNIWKIKKDKQRYNYFKDLGYKVIVFPYYCALTKDMAKEYLFPDDFSEKKYIQMLKEVCNVNHESELQGPGWSDTTGLDNPPANFIKPGIDRFLKELKDLPNSQKHGIIFSLQEWIKYHGPELIVPDDSRISKLLEMEVDEKYLRYYYLRRDGEVYE